RRGIHKSTERDGNSNDGGMTPTITAGDPSMISAEPTADEDPLSTVRQSRSLTTTTASSASEATSVRPAAARTPNTSKNSGETVDDVSRCASPMPVKFDASPAVNAVRLSRLVVPADWDPRSAKSHGD